MKKVLAAFIAIALGVLTYFVFISSSEARYNELAEQIHNDVEEMENYTILKLKESDLSKPVMVRIKKGEELTDIVVTNKSDRNVCFQFRDKDGQLVRCYHVYVPEGHKLVSWGKTGIQTDKATIKLTFAWEK